MRCIAGTIYCNDGDWVESRSALVEHMDGRLELICWADTADEADEVEAPPVHEQVALPPDVVLQPEEAARRPVSA